tara:strand:+ start:1047 stop:1325 length:279 start_codon:yes stop_codon:yes gene_type:complete
MKLKHPLLRNACYRYIKRNGSATTENLIASATLLNGKSVKDAVCCSAKNTRQLANLLTKDSRFKQIGVINVRTLLGWKDVAEWGLNENEEID